MIDIQIEPEIFNTAYIPHLKNLTRTQILYGGSSSGKSVFLAQRCIFDLLSGGRNYLVCRAVGRTIRRSVFNEILKVINDWNVAHLFNVNRSDGVITCVNGYQILFSGLDDPEKIKSMTPAKGVLTDIWVEEATETNIDSIKALYKRQRGGDEDTKKRLTLSFNPIYKTHPIYTEYFDAVKWSNDDTHYQDDELSILKTWYIHNRFLTQGDIHDLEHESDPYYRNVYTFGNWGVLGNVIFKNWRTEDLTDKRDQFTNARHGLDFGYSADPAALVLCHYDRKTDTVYIYDELYERGLTNQALAQAIKPLVGGDYVTCDSSEPKSIAELQAAGISALGAKKGKDSVNFGVQWLQGKTIVIDKRCINTRREFETYKWREDKDGNSLKQPLDKNNHLIDALRYALESEMENTPLRIWSY